MPSKAIKSLLGLRLPEAPEVSPEQRAVHQARVKQTQAGWPAWRKALVAGIEGVGNFGEGLLYDPTQPMPEGATPAYAAGALGAALPFAPKGIKGMYSRVERLAESLPNQIHPNKLLSILKNRVSGQEVEWRGLDKMLQGRSTPVTRGEVVRQLEQNPLDVNVVEYGESAPITSPRGGTATNYGGTYEMPGASNYRETLIQLDKPGAKGKTEDLADQLTGQRLAGTPSADFQDPHWDEPNVLVGVRHNERRLPPRPEQIPADKLSDVDPIEFGSKGRMLENVQSGWQQRGAHSGFAGDPIAKEAGFAEQELSTHIDNIKNELGQKTTEYNRLVPDLELGGINPEGDAQILAQRLWHEVYQNNRGDLERPYRDLVERSTSLDNAMDALARKSTEVVPDMPYKKIADPVRLGIRQQLLDIAHNRPDLEWLGIAPSSELRARGEVISPDFQDTLVPKVLSEELERVLGRPVPAKDAMWGRPQQTDLGIKPKVDINFEPLIGRYGGFTRRDHYPGEPNDLLSVLPGVGPDKQLHRTLVEQRPNVKAPIVRLTPDMLKMIREKGFPIAALLSMLQAQAMASTK